MEDPIQAWVAEGLMNHTDQWMGDYVPAPEHQHGKFFWMWNFDPWEACYEDWN
jgi:hypothetical protein